MSLDGLVFHARSTASPLDVIALLARHFLEGTLDDAAIYPQSGAGRRGGAWTGDIRN